MSELGGEKIDIIEWSPETVEFLEDALSPAQVMEIRIETEPDEEKGDRGHAIAEVASDQQSLAIGRGGQNVRLAAKLTGWKIDIVSANTGEELAEADAEGNVELDAPADTAAGTDSQVMGEDDGTTTKPDVEETLKDAEETQDRDAYAATEENEVDTPEEAEKQLAEAESGGNSLGEAKVEMGEMTPDTDLTSGLPSEPTPEGEVDEKETTPPEGSSK